MSTPGLARLRASPKAEAIRQSVLADQRNGRAEALAKIEAEKAVRWEDAIDIPAAFNLGGTPPISHAKIVAACAPNLPTEAPRARRAPQARANAESPPAARGKRAERLAAAQSGMIPAPPDFTAETNARFRPKLAAVIALVEAGDVAGLAAFRHDGFMGSSMRAVTLYRDLALVALKARAPKAA